jgi:hypothetical protein
VKRLKDLIAAIALVVALLGELLLRLARWLAGKARDENEQPRLPLD